jgi:hypothetical protein
VGNSGALAYHQRESGSNKWICNSILSTTRTITSSITPYFCNDFVVHMEEKKSKGIRERAYRRTKGESNSIKIISHNHDNWSKPEVGEVKCNIDAAIFKEQGCYKISMCIRGLKEVIK